MTRRPLASTALAVSAFVAVAFATSTPAAAAVAGASSAASARGDIVPGRFIVHVRDSADPVAKRTLDESMKHRHSAVLDIDESADIDAYAAELTEAELDELRSHDAVAAIEPDRWISIADTQSSPPSWGLDRIDQRDRPLDSSFTPVGSGSGVAVYVIDTGISPQPEFAGRLAAGRNFHADNGVVNPTNVNDCNGHGTHVAGTAAGTTFGVAKKATLVPLRALGCDGNGMLSAVLAALQWAIDDHPAGAPAVLNLSLAGATNATLNSAVQAAVNDGIVVVVAAGNSNDDACNWSPASAPSAITVGATNSNDDRSSFSNWGTCLDVFAPGSVITSAGLNGGTSTMSGTSMASPHVAGAVAALWSTNPALTRAQVASTLAASSTLDRISGAINGSPNRLLMIGTSTPLPTGNGGGSEPATSAPSQPTPTFTAFVPVAPTRIIDTRTGIGGVTGRIDTNRTLGFATSTLDRPAGTPTAIAVNITATNTTDDGPAGGYTGFLTAYPCDTGLPNASNLNFRTGTTIANSATIPIPASGNICFHVHGTADVIVDLVGWHTTGNPTPTAFVPVAPTRIIDTRTGIGGVTGRIDTNRTLGFATSTLDRPAGTPTAIAVNITATNTTDDGPAGGYTGFLTAYPCDTGLPNASNLNFRTGTTIANSATIPIPASGNICFHVHGTADVIVDLVGWHTTGNPTPTAFVPVAPTRIIDTRTGIGGVTGRIDTNRTLGFATSTLDRPAGTPTAIAVNITATNTTDDGPAGGYTGFLTAYPCDTGLPNASNLNFRTGTTIANSATIPIPASGNICFHVHGTADVIVDLVGWHTS